MVHQFTTAAVIEEAERLMDMSGETGLMGCQIAQALSAMHEQKNEHEKAAFYRVVETYCAYMECCSHIAGNRYKRAFSAGQYCYWPQLDALYINCE